MKIKQKAPQSNTKQTKITKASISPDYHEPVLPPQQVYLPSQLVLYRQLVSQLGIEKGDLQKFRENFKSKYKEHLKLLQGHQISEQKFRISKQYEDIESQHKLKQMRQQISQKQMGASQRKQNVLTKSRQRMEMEQENWKQIIQKNKKQYLRNIKNSMKLIKRWQNKLSTSLVRKNQILDRISSQMQEHNQYVNSVHDHTKMQQNLQSEQRILRLEQSLNMKSAGSKRKTQESQLNPQIIRYKSTSKKTNRNSKTVGSQTQFQKSPSKLRLPISKFPAQDKIKISKVDSQNHLELKSELDQQFLQECLSKNISKSKRIAEARNIKSYMHDQRIRQNRLKKEEFKLKLHQNLEKLQEEQNQKNKRLDQKFQQSRKNSRLINFSPSNKMKNSIAKPTTNISLPVIQQKILRDNSFQYSSVPLKNHKRPSKKYSHSKYEMHSIDSPANRSEHNNLFITDTGQKSGREKEGKYNRKIIQKLRSLSLVANIKYKMDQERSQRDEMRGLIYKNTHDNQTKKPHTYKSKY